MTFDNKPYPGRINYKDIWHVTVRRLDKPENCPGRLYVKWMDRWMDQYTNG